MTKKLSTLLCMLLIAAMVVSMVGCSKTPTEESAAPEAEEASSEPVAEQSEEPESAEEITLEFWDMAWGPAGVYDVLAEEIAHRYEDVATNVKIEYTNNPWANCFELYSTAVASGEAPDVGIGGGFMPFQFAVNGESADLQWIVDSFIAEGQEADFLEGALDYYMYDGVHVGIPFNYDPRLNCIRKDWLEELNLEMPTTYEELIEVAKAFSAKGDDYYGVAFGVTTDSSGPWINMAVGNGGPFYNEDGSANVNSERNKQVMQLFRTLKDEGCLPEGIENYTGPEAVAMFEGGYAGILIKACGNFKQAYETMGGDKVCVLPPLKSPSGVQKAQICVNGYMVFSQSEHLQESLEFLKWFNENNGDLWFKNAQDSFPARISMMNHETMQNEMRQDVIQNVLTNGVTMCFPLISGTASGASIEGLAYDQKILQAALVNDPATWEETLLEIEDEVIDLIADLDP